VTEPGSPRPGGSPGDSWEQRAAGLASEIQRWLIRTSARTMRDELGGQVKKALRGPEPEPGDTWGTATTEPPYAADEAPECAWCPVCRAARRISQARSAPDARTSPRLADAADVMAAAVKDALAGLDTILSYRSPADPGRPGKPAGPPGGSDPRPADQPQSSGEPLRKETQGSGPADTARAGELRADQAEEPEDEPGDRG